MARKAETIFVQIASYRDPDLLNTLKDILDNAKDPKNLRFGIAWQHTDEDEWDNLNEYLEDERFRILDIPYGPPRSPLCNRCSTTYPTV